LGVQAVNWRNEDTWVKYVAPFATFLLLLAVDAKFPLDNAWGAPLRVAFLGVVCAICWPRELSLRPSEPLASVTIGILVFFLWIAPDLLVPGYRQNVLFSNAVIGRLHSSLQPGVLHDPWVLAWRSIRAIIIVPIVEELFWRAWFMRWLIKTDFRNVPLGTYSPFAFWITAILFASEHGPYWDVGLVTGIIYNLWMVRTKSVADCILMHAVTNGVLSAYVIATAQWQYWQ
jgi:uncharacterized protein